MIVLICVIAIFLILAILLLCGKGAFLIAGYNTMTKEEKEKYDSKALCKSTGKFILSLVLCMLFILAADIFNLSYLSLTGGIGIPLCIIFYLIHTRGGEKFRK